MDLRVSSLIIILLALSGCATQLTEWKGTIEDVPPITIDDSNKSENDWIWKDSKNKWIYRDGEPALAEFANWGFENQSFVFRFESPQHLNLHLGKPHSLYLKVYQLTDLKFFKDIIKTPAGNRELLSSGKIDPSIVAINELTISPNDVETLVVDRFKETRFIAIVTGYFAMKSGENIRIFEVPAVKNRFATENFTFSDLNPFAEPSVTEAARIKAWVDLGVTKISRLRMIAQ
ncbi:type VI secretion lipoprotein TssJ [Psychrosphaera sp. F3M07]|uniref:type VI secretion lipoprotein TssJ n=1 Tax=Psychrosphaera sp. F3M07 TaxID=2841560 RepID=UPI001C0878B5|nr:type VI secretion lipoprotein TssJ [Psychrosphaera sp. F3M07]MBU2918678.1 type VI secretion lipoprotein TssJ [Psychrosphaera sp. F3M07]